MAKSAIYFCGGGGGGEGGESMGSFGSVLTELIACWVGPVKKILFV